MPRYAEDIGVRKKALAWQLLEDMDAAKDPGCRTLGWRV